MQNISDLYTTARADPSAWHEYKAVIGGVEYSHQQIAGEPETLKSLFPGTIPIVGGCVSQIVTVGIIDPSPPPPRMAEIELFCRVHGSGVTSEWIPKGKFFIDTRDPYSTPGVLILNGYDAMLKMEVVFIEGADEGNWPRDPKLVMNQIAEKIGVEIENVDSLGSLPVPYPGSLTMREIASGIAAASGGNWTITDAGLLRFVPLTGTNSVLPLGMAAASFAAAEPFEPISRVTLQGEESTFTAGTNDGREMTISPPWVSQEMAQTILRLLEGYVYRPFEAEDARLDPAAELGDHLEINGQTLLLAKAVTKFDLLCAADISAPADEEIDHEYPYVNPSTRRIDRKIAQNRSLIEKTEERILLEVESQSGDIADLQVTASEIESRVQNAEGEISVLQQDSGKVRVAISDQNGTLQTVIDSGDWEAIYKTLAGEVSSGFYFDFTMGRFVFDGTGVFRSKDGNTYIEIVGNELVMYSKYGATGEYLDKIHLGFMSGSDPSGGADTIDYPYMLLGKASGDVGMVKKFYNGLWIGNSAPINATGNFNGMAGASGFFINTRTGKSYVVNGVNMKDVYAGTTNEVVITSDNVSHDGDLLSAAMPVYLDQAEYDARLAAGSINPDTPYFIQKEV